MFRTSILLLFAYTAVKKIPIPGSVRRMSDHASLPTGLPIPTQDGAAAHLLNAIIPPALTLVSTSRQKVTLASQPGLTILFCYPRTSAPDEEVPAEWNSIPGARGCSAQVCAFRDSISQLQTKGVNTVFGLSTQDPDFQLEAKERFSLTYDLLSDESLEFVKAMMLPTFEFNGMTLIKRTTLAIRDGRIERVWYPVFPANESANEVLAWLVNSEK